MDRHEPTDGCETPGRRRYRLADSVVDGAARLDRLQQHEALQAERLHGFVAARESTRNDVLKLGSALTHGTVASPLLGGGDVTRAWPLMRGGAGPLPLFDLDPAGKVHTIPSIEGETVHVGQYDPALPSFLTVEPGDVISYKDTFTHYGGRVYHGIPVPEREQLRNLYVGRSVHSNIGPIAVRGAEPGDVLELRILHLEPIDWGYNNSAPGGGSLPDDFDEARIRFFRFDKARMTTEFFPGVEIPLGPFQGILGVQPAGDAIVSSSPPGPYGGNMDLRELIVGTRLFVPVWHAGGKLWTSDSHAAQGDGEVNLTAIETAMREARIQVLLHKQVHLTWPMVETPTHWISLGMALDLDKAFTIALRQMIGFLEAGLGMHPLDAYSLASVAGTFRITQAVNATKGVHGMLAKDLFQPELSQKLSITTPRPIPAS